MMSSYRQWLLCCVSSSSLAMSGFVGLADEPKSAEGPRDVAASRTAGREIFLREWIPNDPRSHGGDGLGPVFNETSCISCHNQGGVGGGGSEAKNVVVISAVRTGVDPIAQRSARTMPAAQMPVRPEFSPQPVRRPGPPVGPPTAPLAPPPTQTKPAATEAAESPEVRERKQLLQDLRRLHPGLETARSVVLHKSGTDIAYSRWRDQVLGLDKLIPPNAGPLQVPTPPLPPDAGFFAALVVESERQAIQERLPPASLMSEKMRVLLANPVSQSLVVGRMQQPGAQQLSVAAAPTQRNSTALFGVGLIDSIPDKAIEAAASQTFDDFPEITGRVARLKDGRIGRFGWKAQKATLYDFTMVACAVELGLNVPDHPQAGVPLRPDYQPAGFDLNREECRDLVQFLKDLPAPARRTDAATEIVNELKKGELAFAKIGCAACHAADIGNVTGIYSDLLLHDLGSDLGDSGSYGVFQPQSSGDDAEDPLSGLLAQSSPGQMSSPVPFFNPNLSGPQLAALSIEESLPAKMIGAGRQEWRTPPLWGVRDSAPYMHDGRAGTLEQAVAFHGGEAQLSANRFFRLTAAERTAVLTFLRSLVAPET